MAFWLVGQVVFTVTHGVVFFPLNWHDETSGETWVKRELMLAWLPLAFGMGGKFRAGLSLACHEQFNHGNCSYRRVRRAGNF